MRPAQSSAIRSILRSFTSCLGTIAIFLITVAIGFSQGNPIQTIDFPGGSNTEAWGINNNGDIVGRYFVTATGQWHGFKLSGGNYTTIEPYGGSTLAAGINDNGDVVGNYLGPAQMPHGFLLSGGSYTIIDFPNANVNATTPLDINNNGDIVGYYHDNSNFTLHGFRLSGGSFTTIDFPGADNTYADGINDNGEIVGFYYINSTGRTHGFKLSGSNYTTIDFPSALATFVYANNNSGVVLGKWGSNVGGGGFLLSGGIYTTINFPLTTGVRVDNYYGINDNRDVVGSYSDLATGAAHGFRLSSGPPSVEITLENPPANNAYVITAEPQMPQIQARATVINDPNPTGKTITWEVLGWIPSGPGGSVFVPYYDDIRQNQQTPANSLWTLQFVDPNYIRGGLIEIRAKARVNNQDMVATTGLIEIRGTNPTRTVIQNKIDQEVDSHAAELAGYGLQPSEVKDALKRIACQESGPEPNGQRQLRAPVNGGVGPALVSFDEDYGVGIFQITRTPHCPTAFSSGYCRNTVFDWRANIKEGVDVFVQDKIARAAAYPRGVRVNQGYRGAMKFINGMRAAQETPLDPIPWTIGNLPAPDFTHTGLIGTICQNGASCNQLLETSVREYNGNGRTVLRYKTFIIVGDLREFMPDFDFLRTIVDLQNPPINLNPLVWKRVPGSMRIGTGGEPYYFDYVAGRNPTTCVGTFIPPLSIQNQVTLDFAPIIVRLRNAINAEPDEKFGKDSSQSRRELLNIVDDVERKTQAGLYQEAYFELNNLLKPRAHVVLRSYKNHQPDDLLNAVDLSIFVFRNLIIQLN